MFFDSTVAIIFGTLLLSLIASLVYAFWYQSLKHKTKLAAGKDANQSMRVSELEAMIRRSVLEATSSLEDRVSDLEAELQSQRRELSDVSRKELAAPSREPLMGAAGRESDPARRGAG